VVERASELATPKHATTHPHSPCTTNAAQLLSSFGFYRMTRPFFLLASESKDFALHIMIEITFSVADGDTNIQRGIWWGKGSRGGQQCRAAQLQTMMGNTALVWRSSARDEQRPTKHPTIHADQDAWVWTRRDPRWRTAHETVRRRDNTVNRLPHHD
jgi:hypothetical protein